METSRKSTLIFIHGVSGSGKSTAAEMLKIMYLPRSALIDQDSFYKQEKPLVTFEGAYRKTYTAENWDCEEAIDFDAFRNVIQEKMRDYLFVIVTGFALRKDLMKISADYSFILKFDLPEKDIIFKIIETRIKSKGFTDSEKKRRDYYMVHKVLWPFYLETLNLIQPSQEIISYNIDGRVGMWDIITSIVKNLPSKT